MKCFARFSLHLCICVALIGKAFAIAPENGWWWNPSESGSGYAIERQGNSLFMAAFLYEPTGAATWYATGLALQPDGSYKGEMMRYVGGKSLLGAYKPTTSNSVVATASLTFPTPDTGVMTISFASGAAPRTVPITRFAFGSPAFDPSNGSFQNGWWWNDQESGTGYFIEVQGASAFIASFMYDAAGQPTWYASGAGLSGTQLLSGPLDMYANGQSLGGTYKAPTSKAGAAGVMSYDFTSDSAGSMTLPNAAKVAIQRFVFDPSAVTNHIPVPNAGSNQTVSVGDTVYLNGTGTDTDKDTLSFYWRLVTVPTGSKASLVDGQTTRPYFVADVAGTYRVLLLADDGKSSNAQSVVTVTANPKTSANTPPVANAGANQTVAVGASVKLNGAASSDANGDALTYAWFFVTRPSGSLASLTGTTTVSPGFTADVAGNYVIGLNVNDGKASSAQSSVTVIATAANTAPVANAGPSQTVLVGTVVSLNGSASSDANGDALTYEWTLTRPTGSSAVLNNSKSMVTSFIADLAGSYTLTLVVNDGKVNSSPSSVVIYANSASPGLTDLIISEVSTCYYYNYDCWFEIYNPTGTPINIANYNLKSTSIDATAGGSVTMTSFGLPAVFIPADGYAIISGNNSNVVQHGNQNIRVRSGNQVPYWTKNGFIELLKNGATVDFVSFGNSSQKPVTSSKWTGNPFPAIPYSSTDYGKSIVIPYLSINKKTNSALDWINVDWVTPAGRNDVPAGALDDDDDGIPDTSEVPGSTYAGIDLYAMGVRTGRKDILIEVDHMDSTDPGITPRFESLQMVVNAFAVKGINVIFDAGTTFSPSYSVSQFNLGQGNSVVPYERCITLNQTVCLSNVSNKRSIYDWKEEHTDLRRRSIFHYLLFGSTQQDDGTRGSSGRAEIIGNDLIVTMGAWGFTTGNGTNGLNRLINQQASTVMHELGHNLGLDHGGDESINYKPNYWSVMNYMYQLAGLDPDPTSNTAYQRWRLAKGDSTPSLCNLIGSPCGDSSQFVMSYSNGTSMGLDENKLNESDNIGRGSKAGNYADWDLNGDMTKTAISKDLNGDGIKAPLSDHDDWSNLVFPFARNLYGNAGAAQFKSAPARNLSPLHNDRQRFSDESPHLPQHLNER